MKILMVHDAVYPLYGGSVERTMKISKSLVSEGNEVDLLTLSRGFDSEYAKSNGIKNTFIIRSIRIKYLVPFFNFKYFKSFFENYDIIGLKDSYYACVHLESVFEFREIVQNKNFENRDEILRQFTKFTFDMHQKGVEFLDHSPGNTLIKDNNDGTYSFYLVDLNRMKFHESIDFQTRMNNLSHLTPQKEMIAIMSNVYAQLLGVNESLVFETMWKMTESFQFRYHRKKRIKKKLKFWKK